MAELVFADVYVAFMQQYEVFLRRSDKLLELTATAPFLFRTFPISTCQCIIPCNNISHYMAGIKHASRQR